MVTENKVYVYSFGHYVELYHESMSKDNVIRQ